MAVSRPKFDKLFLIFSVALMVAGFFIFNSASLALLAKETSNYSDVAFSQMVIGLFGGTIALIFASRLKPGFWKKLSFYIFVIAIILNILVLLPSVGFEHGGAKRWIGVFGLSLQTSEVLKVAFIIYFAAWAAAAKERIKTFRYGLLPLLGLLGISAGLLVLQPDTDNLILIGVTGAAMLIAAGGRLKHVLIIVLIGIVGLATLYFVHPYIKNRINAFLNPERDVYGADFQVNQSLIAIGSGGIFGRGFGQSVQKFTYLPEPIGDSVFAVVAEEFGFVGSVLLLSLFVLFAVRGLKIASETENSFARLLVVGIVIMLISQAFVNIGAMLGVIPLSGITLPFISHGGTSLFITLLEVGIVLSVSRNRGL
ncbi:MAG: putative peptidoglycan glycosyltransferase FtsW [Minisyncoccia bacterium]